MQFGVRLYGTDPDVLVAKARRAEALGFDSVWRGDHLLLPGTVTTPYPYAPGTPFPTEAPVLDVLVLYGFVAAATTTLRLATGVYVLPLRDPVAVARAVLTVDVLSRGRCTFGVGVGWLREEFELVGRDFTTRGAAIDDAIAVLKSLWTEEHPAHEGRFNRFADTRFEPKPVQRPHPPIVVGGESPAALERAAVRGDGWYGHVTSPAEVAPVVQRLRARRVEAGRADDPFEVTVRVPATVSADDVTRFEEVGVDRLVLQVGAFEETSGTAELAEWEAVAARLLP